MIWGNEATANCGGKAMKATHAFVWRERSRNLEHCVRLTDCCEYPSDESHGRAHRTIRRSWTGQRRIAHPLFPGDDVPNRILTYRRQFRASVRGMKRSATRQVNQQEAASTAALPPLLDRGIARALAAVVSDENRLAFARSLT